MKLLALVAVSLAAVLAPAAPRAQDSWPDDRANDDGYYDGRGDGYDVSVDLDAQGSMDPSEFQQPLSPYGDWVSVGSYGTVWRPHVAAGWRPYYYGRWEWTTEGWLWVSDEPFGWATYHYGRWAFDRGFGWVWVPGTQWAPAWVSWRYSGDVVGWAPLAPGLSLYVTDFAFVDFWWTFVPTTRFCGGPVYRYAYAPHYTRRWWDATRPAPPRPAPPSGGWASGRPRPAGPAWGGPSSRFVEDRAGRPIRPSRIVPAAAAGEHRARPGEISVYRPEARMRPAPAGGQRRVGPGLDGSRSRAWEGGRPSAADRSGAAPAQPRREDRGPGGRSGSGWSGGRPAPRAEAPVYVPSDRGERRSGTLAPRSEAAPQPRPSSPAPSYAPAPGAGPGPSYAPPQSSPRGGGDGGGRGGGHPARPSPSGGGERGGHRR